MTIDELKAEWNRTSLRVEELEKDNAQLANELHRTKLLPSQTRLASSYRGMMIAGWALVIGGPFFFFCLFSHFWPAPVVVPLIFWEVLFLIGATGDTWLYRNACGIDLGKMTVEEVAARAYKGRKVHLILQAVMIPIAVAFLWYLYLDAPADGRIGMLIGGAIGVSFGFCEWLRIMRSYKALIAA